MIFKVLSFVFFKYILHSFPASKALANQEAHTHQLSPSFKPGKPNSGWGVTKSFPADLHHSRKSLFTFAQTVCNPLSLSSVLQQPSLYHPVKGFDEHSCAHQIL